MARSEYWGFLYFVDSRGGVSEGNIFVGSREFTRYIFYLLIEDVNSYFYFLYLGGELKGRFL